LALGAAGCVSSGSSSSSGSGGNAWATAASAQAGGGMDALVAAAKAEGTLNVIALPPDWANYGNMLKAFTDKYGIKIDSANPDGSSQDEINAVKQLGTQDRAPDVLDLGQSFALGNMDLYAPYKVATFDSIPAANKDANGAWVNDYGGYISIGCNSTLVPVCPASFADLAKPEYAGKVALNGDPTQAASAFASVWAGSLANGGSLDDINPGVTFWGSVAKSGNLLKVDPNSATIQSGQTPIVLDWDYLNVAETEKNKASFDWKVAVPTDGLFAQYYAQAINKNAPHPAAARLWQEFLYSDEGQNLWLAGKARPIRLEAMTAGGTADKALLAALPPVSGEARFPTQAQTDAANKVVAQNWATATS
jgi:putative spermidine/putrescine transport system substrate-binding protein